jgi:hypothetical protein
MRACKEESQPRQCPGFASAGPDPAAESRDRLAAYRAILKRTVDIADADGDEAEQAFVEIWKAADRRCDELAWERAKAAVREKKRG